MVHYRFVVHDKQLGVAFSPKAACTTIKNWLLDVVVEAGCDPRPAGIDRVPKEFGELGGQDLFRRFPKYPSVLFMRDPLRRLVSFYAHFVVRDDRTWCFADRDAQRPLVDMTFRETVTTLQELAASNRPFQHHLFPQTEGMPGAFTFDETIAIETLDSGIERLSSLIGRSLPTVPRLNATSYDNDATSFAADANVEYLRARGLPAAECFYDASLARCVEEVFAADCRMYRSIAGVTPLAPAVV